MEWQSCVPSFSCEAKSFYGLLNMEWVKQCTYLARHFSLERL